MADDLILNVRQISQYPLQPSIAPPAIFLYQDGVGGPYKSVYGYNLVGTALASGSTDMFIAPNFGLRWNGSRFWWDLGSFQFSDRVEAPQFFQDGDLVATLPQLEAVAAAGVHSFNGRIGDVLLEEPDILRAGGLLQNNPHLHGWATSDTPNDITTNDDSIATCLWVQRLICFALDNTVTSFNGRVGDITLTTADVNAAFMVPGPPWPSASNPALGDASNRIATTLFVDDSVEYLKQDIINTIGPPPDLSGYAPLASPAFTGVPTAPTATVGSSTGQLATTAFVAAAVTASTTGVASFNTRTGAVVLTTADITNAGGATLASPVFTGNPTAPTAAPGDNDTSLATTAFVHAAVAAIAVGVSSFNTRTGAVVLTSADVTGVGGAPIASPSFSGVPLAPTAAPGTNTTQLATTAFVAAAVAALPSPVSSFNGRTGAVSFQANDISAVGGALLSSPVFTGTPQAPTQAPGSNNTDIATTAFVQAALTAGGGVVSFNGRAGAITLLAADVTGAGGAPLASPAFTGVPSAATATSGTNTTQLATTAFVQAALSAAPGGVSSFNSRTGAITLIGADVSAAGGALLASPTFTGTPHAPTPTNTSNDTTLATTAFVQGLIATAGGVNTFNGRAGAVTLNAADVFAAGGSTYVQADTAPAFTNNRLWFDSVGGQLYVHYHDPSTSADNWVIANSPPPPAVTYSLSRFPATGAAGNATTTAASFTTPSNSSVNTVWKVRMCGAGGGGAGTATSAAYSGSGGGGGQYKEFLLSGVAASTVMNLTVGNPGAAGVGNAASPLPGGNTTLTIAATGTTIGCGGGQGPPTNAGVTWAYPGSGGTGGVTTPGSATVTVINDINGGNGVGNNANASMNGWGGGCPLGVANPSFDTGTLSHGITNPNGYGCGGAGAWSPPGTGWNGLPGIVIIERVAG
jgi:hypothetical protein